MKIPTAFVIQNQDNSFWGKSGAVTSLGDARVFTKREHAQTRIDRTSKMVSEVGALKVTIVPVIGKAVYSLPTAPVEVAASDVTISADEVTTTALVIKGLN